jgi:putative heme-binding domain-containing protein
VKGLDLKACSDAELAAYQSHDNDWYVRQARKILQERVTAEPQRAAAIREALARVAPAKDAPAAKQLRHLWAMHAVGGQDYTAVVEDAELPPEVRAWAVQLALEDRNATPEFLAALRRAAKADPSALVRRYIASGLQRIAVENRTPIAAGLLSHTGDAADFNLPLLTWYAIEPVAGADPKAALELVAGSKNTMLLQFTARRIAAGRQYDGLPEALAKALASKDTRALLAILRGMGDGFKGRRDVPMPESWTEVSEQLLKYDADEVRSLAASLSVTFGNTKALNDLRIVVADTTATAAKREAAITTLVAARDQNLPPILQKLLADSAVRRAALRGLAAFDDSKTPAAILGVWASLTSDERRDALGTLAARPVFAHALLDAVTAKQLSPADVPADVVRAMRGLPDQTVATKIKSIWGVIRDTASDKAGAIAAVRKTLATQGNPDLALGRAIFAKACQQCHTLYGTGGKIGPDITGSNRADLDYLLENILDPSAVIPKEYMATTFRLGDGRTVMGIVKGDDGTAFTVQTATEVLTVARDDVDELKHSKTSMMPDGLLQTLKPDEVRALFAYLRNPKQSPILATVENAKDLFNGKDLTGWVGDAKVWSVDRGEIVGRADDLAKDSALVSEMTAGDFRLSFRARAKGGAVEVRGGSDGNTHRIALGGAGLGKPEEWNECVVEVRGSRVRVSINGRETTDLIDEQLPSRGVISLHLTAGSGVEIRVKDLRLEVLDGRK